MKDAECAVDADMCGASVYVSVRQMDDRYELEWAHAHC